MNDKKVLVVIPARYESSRFPGKPLVIINGKTMIHNVYNQISLCKFVDNIIVATDDDRIYNDVTSWGGLALMTSRIHTSGTDRVGEAALKYKDFQIIINVQGDEPFINPKQVDDLIKDMLKDDAQIATQCNMITEAEEIFDYNVVKVVKSQEHKALYFSRQAIPAHRDLPFKSWYEASKYYRHVGIYGFKREALLKLIELKESSLELSESLEQLRWLENDFEIKVYETQYKSKGIDTPEDLK
jgi:3-deoxy-manno-octulosonate cytidylyltransferase (CMP-KDO synthetase)